jgi:hypothetical protein
MTPRASRPSRVQSQRMREGSTHKVEALDSELQEMLTQIPNLPHDFCSGRSGRALQRRSPPLGYSTRF